MFGLVLIIVVFLVGLTVFLWVGTLFVQGLIYNDPVGNLYWRAPAAAAALVGFVALWCLVDYANLDPYQPDLPVDTLFRFQPTRVSEVDKLWSVKVPQQALKDRLADKPETLTEYQRRPDNSFRDKGGRPWQRSDPGGVVAAILIEENGQKVRFEADSLNREGQFVTTSDPFPGYHEVRGRRVMTQLGQLTLFRWTLWLPNMLVNGLHLALWFAALWLLLRFQWLHALGLTVILWGVMTLVLVPMVLDRTYNLAREKAGLVRPEAAVPIRVPGRLWAA